MYRLPKTDWIASDYFNYTDYSRIIDNVTEIKKNGDEIYSNIPAMQTMEVKSGYTAIPYADNWNAIDSNINALNFAIFGKSLEIATFSDNGYAPNYDVFNKWESVSARLFNHVIAQLNSLDHLEIILGSVAQYGVRVHYLNEEILGNRLGFVLGMNKGDIAL